jgi:mRNA interferase RelE/StbE
MSGQTYRITFTGAALREIRALDAPVQKRVEAKIAGLADGLSGDVKRLRDFSPRYRLRVGDWRVLFDIEGDAVVVRHVSHRSRAYE